jgi:hypothetical protein
VLLGRWVAWCGASCDETASLLAKMEVNLKSSLGFSDGSFGAPLAASCVEEANERNQVATAGDDGS